MRQLPPTRLELGRSDKAWDIRGACWVVRLLSQFLRLTAVKKKRAICPRHAELSIWFLATLRIRSILLRDKALLSVNAPLGPNVLFSTGHMSASTSNLEVPFRARS